MSCLIVYSRSSSPPLNMCVHKRKVSKTCPDIEDIDCRQTMSSLSVSHPSNNQKRMNNDKAVIDYLQSILFLL